MTAGRTVLILDDSLTVRMDLVEAFTAAGWTTAPCATAVAAWEFLAGNVVDVVVLDVLLPDADGVDVLRALRTAPATATLPVLMLSSEAQVKDRIRGLQTGADEYVGKPYNVAYLVARAQELVRVRSGEGPGDRSGEAAGRPRILVIDDSATVRQMLREALEGNGYEVLAAGSGLEGLRLAASARADAVLVDGGLPDIDGATVIRRLRLDAALRGLPCLLLTASDDASAELGALEAGADAFVRKDADPSVVLAKLSAALRRGSEGSSVLDTASLLGPKKILAIGGEAGLLAALAARVRGEGYDVVSAGSGDEALELLTFETMDCILLQLADQDQSGLAMCRRIKSAPGVRDVPLVLMALDVDPQAMIEALAAGADDYVLLSGDVQVLAARIRAQLRRRQLQDEHRLLRETLLRQQIEAAEARAAAEIALSKAAMVEELERKNLELEAFSYSVSHDLRAPLRTVDGFVRSLSENLAEHLDENGTRQVKRIHGEVARMNEMIDDLLELSRVGRAQLRRGDVDLAALAEVILADLAAGAPDRQVTVVIEAQLRASADPRLIRNVFENLIGNAWKFTAKTPSAIVEVGCEQSDRGPAYFVRDNGSGFDMARSTRLFSPFQRLHSQSDFPGTGIGLATVYRIVDRHGGQVWAEAAIGHGATFRFTLPV
ncbi:MAG TPA: response regulator [Kineosporiaceae bacterium]|nr:response regulator [Kineosporiaceae bacterium]